MNAYFNNHLIIKLITCAYEDSRWTAFLAARRRPFMPGLEASNLTGFRAAIRRLKAFLVSSTERRKFLKESSLFMTDDQERFVSCQK